MIRLKDNRLLLESAFHLEGDVTVMAAIHPEKFIALYGEFSYQAKRCGYSRHVICKTEKRPGEIFVRIHSS